MKAIQFALEKEKAAEADYRQLAAAAPNEGLRQILTSLADAEARHAQTLRQMRRTLPKIEACRILGDAHAVFAKMKADADAFVFPDDAADLYRAALEREQASCRFYQEQADATPNLGQQGVLLLLAREEQQHALLLENLIEFASRPAGWLENTEFNHLLADF
jgi:rubrerythrin